MISPDVTTDIIRSIIDKGEKRDGYMPTFFHGDHASTFISGSWLRGLHDFDLERAYKLILKMLRCPVKEDVAIWMSIWSEVGLLKRHSECTHMGRIQRGCDQDPGICLRWLCRSLGSQGAGRWSQLQTDDGTLQQLQDAIRPLPAFGEVRLTMVAGFRISIRIIPITSTCTVRPMHGTPSSSPPRPRRHD